MNRRGRCAVAVVVMALSATAGPLTAQREAEVRAALGERTTPIAVRLAPNRAHVPSVAIMDASGSGADAPWLTTLWQAAFVAAQATNSSVLDFEFTLRVSGPIDGPSAGLLTASTLTALLKGKKLLPNTTMTGSVNPDGSAGPVDDVLSRLRVAASDGVKRFGFPLGGRQQVDAAGKVTDLLVEGEKLGVEVKELANLDEAYLFLTGDALTRPAAASESEMELWPVELAGLTRMTAQVRSEFEAERASLETALEAIGPKALSSWKEFLERATRQATDLEKSGDTVRANVIWTSILMSARSNARDAQLLSALTGTDPEAVFALLKTHEDAVAEERLKLRQEIETRFPHSSRANDLYALDVLESAVGQGLALRVESDAKALRALDPKDPTFKRLARQHAENLVRVQEELRNGQRYLLLYASLPRLKKALPPLDAVHFADSYAASGAASRSALKARASSLEKDPTWLDLISYGELLNKETDPRSRLVLAARQTIYAAYLVNTYDALGGKLDDKGNLSIRNSRALAAQLDQARVRVLQSCGQAKRETGSIPFPARTRFLNARAAREGNDQQKAETLSDLWISNWWCEFAARDKK